MFEKSDIAPVQSLDFIINGELPRVLGLPNEVTDVVAIEFELNFEQINIPKFPSASAGVSKCCFHVSTALVRIISWDTPARPLR